MSSSCRTSLNLLLCLLSSQISLFEMSQIRNSPFTACPCLFLALLSIFVCYLCLSLFSWSFFIYSCTIMGVYRSLKLYFQVQHTFTSVASSPGCCIWHQPGVLGITEWLRLEGTTGGIMKNLQFVAT